MANKRNTSLQSTYPISEAHDNDIIVSSREIFLHGHIEDGEDGGIDSRVSNQFLKNLKDDVFRETYIEIEQAERVIR